MKDVEGGVTAARGFSAAGVHCGIKKSRKDLAVVFSDTLASAAGVFTTNKAVAAPVVLDKEQLEHAAAARAIVVNSGNANACTGEQGMQDACDMVKTAGEAFHIPAGQVLVSSTGVIGKFLPMDRVTAGIQAAALQLSSAHHAAAAEAIMTTDTFMKETAVQVDLYGATATIGGMAKGSGMIAPNMATMLAFITTDAAVAPAVLQEALKTATDRSFNRISVDGDTSTNDMVLLLANGCAGNSTIESANDPRFAPFYEGLEEVLVRLSKMIVMDGEGATKFVEIKVEGASTEEAAVTAARAVANSNLVKTAIHGEDANWGRILAAVGYSGIDFDPAAVEIHFGNVPILGRHYAIDFSEEAAKQVLSQKEIAITVDLNQGDRAASFWTCDLSHQYVTINASYRS